MMNLSTTGGKTESNVLRTFLFLFSWQSLKAQSAFDVGSFLSVETLFVAEKKKESKKDLCFCD